jgi:hypothetical protein
MAEQQIDLDVFDSRGILLKNFDNQTRAIEALPQEQRAKFFELVAAATACEECEAQLKTDEQDLHARVRLAVAAREHLERVTPKITFLEALRAVQGRPHE